MVNPSLCGAFVYPHQYDTDMERLKRSRKEAGVGGSRLRLSWQSFMQSAATPVWGWGGGGAFLKGFS